MPGECGTDFKTAVFLGKTGYSGRAAQAGGGGRRRIARPARGRRCIVRLARGPRRIVRPARGRRRIVRPARGRRRIVRPTRGRRRIIHPSREPHRLVRPSRRFPNPIPPPGPGQALAQSFPRSDQTGARSLPRRCGGRVQYFPEPGGRADRGGRGQESRCDSPGTVSGGCKGGSALGENGVGPRAGRPGPADPGSVGG